MTTSKKGSRDRKSAYVDRDMSHLLRNLTNLTLDYQIPLIGSDVFPPIFSAQQQKKLVTSEAFQKNRASKRGGGSSQPEGAALYKKSHGPPSSFSACLEILFSPLFWSNIALRDSNHNFAEASFL